MSDVKYYFTPQRNWNDQKSYSSYIKIVGKDFPMFDNDSIFYMKLSLMTVVNFKIFSKYSVV